MSGSDLCIPRNETARPQNYYVLSSNFHIHASVSYLYISRIGLPILLQPNSQNVPGNTVYNCSQVNECRNWERGRTVSFLGIHKPYFHYSESWERDV
jgi:hypothetical protein